MSYNISYKSIKVVLDIIWYFIFKKWTTISASPIFPSILFRVVESYSIQGMMAFPSSVSASSNLPIAQIFSHFSLDQLFFPNRYSKIISDKDNSNFSTGDFFGGCSKKLCKKCHSGPFSKQMFDLVSVLTCLDNIQILLLLFRMYR